MSPNEISVLLSIHVCGKVDRALSPKEAPIMFEYIRVFIEDDMIEATENRVSIIDTAYELTLRGKAYVEYLQNIPLPREKISWVIDQLPFPPDH